MQARDFDLGALLSPMSEEEFFRDHWEKQPLLVPRHAPDHYAGLLSTADVEEVIAFTHPKFLDPGAFSTGKPRDSSYVQGWLANRQMSGGVYYPGIAELRRVYGQGKTVVLMTMQQRWRPVATLCRNLESVFHCPVHANMYLTPPGAQGFDVHFDTHEVLVLQLEGSKTWRLYGAPYPMPLVTDTLQTPKDQLGAAREVHLEPGDLLYLPRGFVHEAYTSEGHSLHLTVGVNVFRWVDLLHETLDQMTRNDERFRASLPPGLFVGGEVSDALKGRFRELLDILGRDGRVADAVRGLGDQFFGQLPVLPGIPFSTPEVVEGIDQETLLEKSPGAICRVLKDEGWVTLEFPGGQVGGPLKIAPALEFVARNQQFAVHDLPDPLGTSGKLVLARRLVREGLFRIASQTPTEREDVANSQRLTPGSKK